MSEDTQKKVMLTGVTAAVVGAGVGFVAAVLSDEEKRKQLQQKTARVRDQVVDTLKKEKKDVESTVRTAKKAVKKS